ncbi:MAG: hypothetical protein WCK38_03055 [Candidatus Omnitrophota bacterium]
MKLILSVLFMFILGAMLLSPVIAEVSSVSVEKREAEIDGLIKDSLVQKDMRPEVTIQLQKPAASSLAQPTVSTLAQPREILTMTAILDIIKNTPNIATPDKKVKSE